MKLSPTKHAHPDKTVMAVSYKALEKLRKERVMKFDALSKYLVNSKLGTKPLLMPSLNFLFLLGLVEYRSKTDSIEYVGK